VQLFDVQLLFIHFQETTQQDGQQSSSPATSTATVAASTTSSAQQQTLKQLASTATVSMPTAVSTSTMNGPTQPVPAAAASPAQPVQQAQPAVQPVLKPPPPVARARPQPFNPSPFTRHMSLRYKSTPMSLGPLRGDTGKGYATLAEESQPPKLPQTVDALNIHGNQQQPASLNYQAPFAPQVGNASPGMPAVTSMSPPVYNGLNTNVTQSFGQSQLFNTQPVQANPWSPPVSQLKRTPSDAEKWLQSAENMNKANGSNSGLLTTHNPFATTATTSSGLTGTWSTDLNKSLPTSLQQTNQNAWSAPNKVEEDDFASLASRHTGSPVSSPRTSTNPFNTGTQVYWV